MFGKKASGDPGVLVLSTRYDLQELERQTATAMQSQKPYLQSLKSQDHYPPNIDCPAALCCAIVERRDEQFYRWASL